jgi:membrane-anchored mycosin MYCP
MRRFAGAALASGFAISALVPLTILAGPAGAAPGRAGRAAGALGGTAAATATPSPTPKTSRSATPPTGQPVPPPTQQAAPPGPPAPVQGMPEPSANCLSQRGRTHLTSEPWAQRALDFSSVWDLTRGQHITVAVVDSGIDYTPQLAGRVSRVDLTGGNGEDCIPHGTVVASIVAASDARAKGIPFYGVAPAAHILSIRVQQQEGTSGQTNAQRRKTLVDIASGIRYAVVKQAKVINVSIQVSASYPALRSAVEFALRHNVVVVAAAGNDNPGGGQGPFYPASYPGVLSVNAVDQSGQLGGFDVNRTPVSVTAPGVSVASDYPGGFDPSNNGTSFATAFVSGEAALVRAAYPRMPAAQVVHRIIATAAGRTGAHTGAGMINPVQAVTAVLPPHPAVSAPAHLVPVPRPRAVNSYTRTVALSVTAGALLTAALVAIGAVVIPQGRRRHWRPGRLTPAPAASPPLIGAPEANSGADSTPRRSHPLPPMDGRPPQAPAQRPEATPRTGGRPQPETSQPRAIPAQAPPVLPPGTPRSSPSQHPANVLPPIACGPTAAPAEPDQLPLAAPSPSPSELPDVRPPVSYGVRPAEPDQPPGAMPPPAFGEFPAGARSPAAPGELPLTQPPASPEPPPATTPPPAAGQPPADVPSPTEPAKASPAELPAGPQPPSAATPPTAPRPPGARHRRRRK